MSPDEFAKSTRASNFSGAYYFYGDDDYRMREAIRFLCDQYLPEALRATNIHNLDLNDDSVGALLAELAALPLLGERKALVALNPQRLSPKGVDSVLNALKAPADDRVVVFWTRSNKKPRKTANFLKKFIAQISAVEFKRLTRVESEHRAARIFRDNEVEISRTALDGFLDVVEGDLGRLTTEAEKLIAYTGNGGKISEEVVDRVCSAGSGRTVFQLVEQISAMNSTGALKTLDKLLLSGESPTGILFWISDHYMKLFLVKGGRQPQAPPWLVIRLRSQASRFKESELESAITRLAKTEADIKGGAGGAISGAEAIRELALFLCQSNRS